MGQPRKIAGSKRGASLLSWRKRKRLNARSEKGSQKWWYEVGCPIHGVHSAKGQSFKVVRVGVPLSRRERMSGCPYPHE